MMASLMGDWERKRPIWLLILLNKLTEEHIERENGQLLLDFFMKNAAKAMGKDVDWLESAEEQMRPFNLLSLEEVSLDLHCLHKCCVVSFIWTVVCTDLVLCVQTLYCVCRPCIVCADLVLCVQTLYCVCRPCTVCTDLVLCVQTLYCVCRPCTVCADLVLCVQTYNMLLPPLLSCQVTFAFELQLEILEEYILHNKPLPQMVDVLTEYTCGRFSDVAEQGGILVNNVCQRNMTPDQIAKLKAMRNHLMLGLRYRRNRKMAVKVVEKIITEPNKTHFVAVGAGHLIGNRSVIHYLQLLGYQVEHMTCTDHIAG